MLHAVLKFSPGRTDFTLVLKIRSLVFASLHCRHFRIGAHDLKFAAILTWEKWVGWGWGKMEENLPLPRYFSFQPDSNSLGRFFVSLQASSKFESKMALA